MFSPAARGVRGAAAKAAVANAAPPPSVTAVARPAPYATERDFIDALYHPHTVLSGLAMTAVVVLGYLWLHSTDEGTNVKLGGAAAVVCFLFFAATHFPDGIMVRPHPVLWRVVGGIALMYLLLVVFLFFQDLPTIRRILAFYDPELRYQLPERSYAEDCRMSTETDPHKWWSTIMDEFILAHAMGYWAKTLVLRDWRIVTAVSVGFEVLEVTFQHWLPNFKECWWDHIIADVLICNAGGTLLGILTLRLIGAKRYHWVKVSDIPGIAGKAGRLLRQFTPRQLDSYEWGMFTSLKRFSQVMLLLTVMFVQEMNCFIIKYVLWQEPKHHLVIGRLAFWGILALPGLREFYDFITVPTVKRLGTIAWIGAFALFFETLWMLKMVREGNYFRVAFPPHILVPWVASVASFATWIVLYFSMPSTVRRSGVVGFLLNVLFYSVFAWLLAVCVMGNPDTKFLQQEFDTLVRPLCDVLSSGWC